MTTTTRRLRVCLYTPSVDPSGMGAHMVDLAAEMTATCDVAVMAWATPAGVRVLERASGVGARALPLPRPRSPGFARRVMQHLDQHPADVFHAHVGTGRENWDGARAARTAGVPAVLETVHLPWLMGSPKHRVPLFASLEPLDRLLTVSWAQRRTYERIGVPAHLLATVPNGIRPRGEGPGRETARRTLGLDLSRPVVMAVGRLITQKGHRALVRAVPTVAERFGDVAVVIVGQGHLEHELRRLAESLGVADHVHLPGHRTDARQLLDAADVFALPSRQEGMPLAALEAMDAGLPVVATDVIGTSEVVQHGVTGTLVRRDDPAALAGALVDLLGDPALRARYGAAGRRRFEERFTSARMAAQTLAVYEDVLAGARLDELA